MDPLRAPATEVVDVVVVGAGIAGLVAARECVRVGLTTAVLDEAEELGGCVRRVELGGHVVDAGAAFFEQGDGSVAALAGELGLGADVVASDEVGVCIWVPAGEDEPGGRGRVLPTPADSLWGVPANPLAADVRDIVGGRGSLRAWADRVMPFLKVGRAKSLGRLVRTRMGDAVADRITSTVVYGLLTRDAELVDVDRLMPGLNQAITRTGSLSGGIAELVGVRGDSFLAGLRGGMTRLVDALRGELEHYDARLERATAAVGLERTDDPDRPWLVRAERLDVDETVEHLVSARFVILAAPARTSLALLAGADPAWAPLAAEPWSAGATETVVLLLDAPELERHAGTRRVVFVPRADPTVSARSIVDETSRWEWLDAQTGPGVRVLRLHYDPAAHPELLTLGDDELVDLALADASAAFETPLDRSRLLDAARVAHRDTSSAYLVGQEERIEALRTAIAAEPTIEVAGSWLAGPRLAQVVPDARAAAHRIRRVAIAVD